ncbi:fibropellin-1-like isoform X3 [Sycon ciliatum]|uniref:fibropellin-1-like isoform X3 n=1 Tax=Sycon ciliatum TaxID=27933 RepID=UPI0031F6FF32
MKMSRGQHHIFLLLPVAAIICLAYWVQGSSARLCTIQRSRTVQSCREVVEQYQEAYYTVCWNWDFSCTLYRVKYRKVPRCTSVSQNYTAHQCCDGYVAQGGNSSVCVPAATDNHGESQNGTDDGGSGDVSSEKKECRKVCHNGGSCSSPNKCTCATGWKGKKCQTSVCSSPCLNGGRCTAPSTCSCEAGYTGSTCGDAICSSPCLNGGRCTAPSTCSCAAGYTGSTCGDAVCTSPCLNGGRCTAPSTCSCAAGYTGSTCGDAVCTSPCLNGGRCTAPSTCSCAAGYTGSTCGDAVCTSPCLNGGRCTAPSTCSCTAGYIGSTCGDDIDECVTGAAGCEHGCQNTFGRYTCGCRRGYMLMNDNHTCADIPECSRDNGGCEHQCIEELGSYRCQCNAGYAADRYNSTRCHDIDECNPDRNHLIAESSVPARSPCEHRCRNREGTYRCRCSALFKLRDDKHKCERCITCKTFAELKETVDRLLLEVSVLKQEVSHLRPDSPSAPPSN